MDFSLHKSITTIGCIALLSVGVVSVSIVCTPVYAAAFSSALSLHTTRGELYSPQDIFHIQAGIAHSSLTSQRSSPGLNHKISYKIDRAIGNFIKGVGHIARGIGTAISHLPSVISHIATAITHTMGSIIHRVFSGAIPNLASITSIASGAWQGSIDGVSHELLPNSAVVYDIENSLRGIITYEGPALLQDIPLLVPPIFMHAVQGANDGAILLKGLGVIPPIVHLGAAVGGLFGATVPVVLSGVEGAISGAIDAAQDVISHNTVSKPSGEITSEISPILNATPQTLVSPRIGLLG